MKQGQKKSITAQSILIIGSNLQGRQQKVKQILGFDPSLQTNNPDFFLLSGETTIGIEEVRSLQNFLSLKPFSGSKKYAFIAEAQALTTEAQNALLKTLEEPPEFSLIILTAREPSLLSPTIVSRCQIIQLTPESQITLNEDEIKNLTNLFNKLLSSSIGERFKIAEELGIFKDRQTALSWLDSLTFPIRKILLAGKLSPNVCLSGLSLIEKTKKYLQANCNVRLTIEAFLLDLPSYQHRVLTE